MNYPSRLFKRSVLIGLLLLAVLILAACGDDDKEESKPTATTPPTATVAPTPEPTKAPTKAPTSAPTEETAATEESTSAAVQVVHPEGTGACAATQVTMGGSFTMCLTATCDVPLDSGPVKYENKTDVGGCTEEGLIGVCETDAFDMYYYDGDPASLQMGCGFMRGTWKLAGS